MTEEEEWDAGPAVERLRDAGWTMKPPPTPPPPKTCIVCGTVQDDRGWDAEPYMTDVTVETARGEEGWAQETRWVCFEDLCMPTLADALIKLGFGSHRHGGINFLEQDDCPGVQDPSACPQPEDEDEDEW